MTKFILQDKIAHLEAYAAHHNQQDPDGSLTQSEPNVTKKDRSATIIKCGHLT